MPMFARRSQFDLSLEVLRRDHPREYRRWVLVGVLTSLFGYTMSTLVFVTQQGWRVALRVTDPYVAFGNVVALVVLWLGAPRVAAWIALGWACVDIHYSLLTLGASTLNSTGLVVPLVVLASGLLFGGGTAFIVAVVLAISVPTALWLGAVLGLGSGFGGADAAHYTVALEGVLITTTALLAAYLWSFAEILRQHERSEARSRELQSQLQHSQKLEAIGLLAGGIAHDFNNLLTAIGGYGSLLEHSSDPHAREFGSEIVATQQRGALLTRQLLAFARKDIAQPRPIDLAITLRDMTALLERAVGERVRLLLDCAPDCGIVADPGRIEQVVLNLVVNARDAMPEGGRVWVRCAAASERVRLEVEDEGVGMDEATQQRVFEPFFTTKGRDHGTGLGLATVHGIVAGSGGSIELDSQIGRGTRFRIEWPRAALVAERERAPAVALDGAGRSVLLVEDNDGARVFIQRLLADRRFRVESARNAEEALDLAARRSAPPDLVLSDVIMPGLSGPQFVSRLKQRWPALRALFISGYLGDVALGDGFDPAADLVPKPFTAAELLARIARKLEA
jgi:signal transduction histidine kinase/CheY-like chemotaxis protein